MFKRSLIGIHKRVLLNSDDLVPAPAFFDFTYSLLSDYEGHEEAVKDGRYFALPEDWISSFGEMYSSVAGRRVELLSLTSQGAVMQLSGGVSVRFTHDQVEYGQGIEIQNDTIAAPICVHGLEQKPCTLEFVLATAKGLPVTSAADFGDYLEFGIDGRYNLGLRQTGFHLISTER